MPHRVAAETAGKTSIEAAYIALTHQAAHCANEMMRRHLLQCADAILAEGAAPPFFPEPHGTP